MTRQFYSIKEESNYYKDAETGAIVFINKNEAQLARDRKAKRKQEADSKKQLQNKVNMLEQKVDNLQDTLTRILEKL